MENTLLTELSDRDLLARVQRLVDGEHRTTAALVAHLAEIESRKLYLREGCASMFIYCTQVLHLSEHAAYHRIAAARLARRFPAVLVGLERGDVHVTALEMLAPHLTPENHRELLAAAKHRTKREILELIASVQPKPDVAAAIRKMPVKPTPVPARTPAAQGGAAQTAAALAAHPAAASDTNEEPKNTSVDGALFVLTPPSAPRKVEIVPLAPERYKVQFTASAATCDKLRRAQELLRHRIPNGDVATVVDEALDLLVRNLERKKFAGMTRPRRPATGEQQLNAPGTSEQQSNISAPSEQQSNTSGATPAVTGSRTGPPLARNSRVPAQTTRSRHIPAAVKRIVWQRDHGRCTFVSPGGARCNEHGRLEFDHIHPHSDGGDATAANVRLLCRAHNQYEAQQFFGVWEASG